MKAPRLTSLPPRLALHDARTAKPEPKVGHPFYHSAAWIAVRDAVLEQRGRRCQHCGATGVRVVVDHVIELSDGGAALDPANLEVLDMACHAQKTARARAARLSRRY